MGIIEHHQGLGFKAYDCYTIFGIGVPRFLFMVTPLVLFLITLAFLIVKKKLTFRRFMILFVVMLFLYILDYLICVALGVNLNPFSPPPIDYGPCY